MKKVNLKFYDNVKPLNIKEYKYWRRLLSKVLKVGAELEFNLSCSSGNCKGYNSHCICPELIETVEGDTVTTRCEAKCIFLEDNLCKLGIRNTASCANAISTCKNNMCKDCNKFSFECRKYYCLNYTASCLTCPKLMELCMGCNERFDVNKNPDTIRKTAEVQLDATQNFGFVGKKGVLQVVGDGSLENNGLEVPTVGRRLNFDVFKEMFQNILTVAKKNGGYANDRCSFHVHVLNEYYTKVNNCHGSSRNPDRDAHLNLTSFEKKMPDIILTNIIQLWRKYETAIYWMSCGLPDINCVTRWEKFRVSLLRTSPIFMSIQDIMDSIGELVGKRRYGALNLSNTKLDGTRLHLEFRICDMIMSESYMTAMCCLFYTIIMKAVDISCYGLLNVEDSNWIAKEQSIKKDFINGAGRGYGDDRRSNTVDLHKHTDSLSTKALELIDLLSPILSGFSPAEEILRSIANKPVAYRLIDAMAADNLSQHDVTNKYDIEKNITSILEENKNPLGIEEEDLLKTIALGKVHGCDSIQTWVSEISRDSNVSTAKIEEYINKLSDDIYWNKSIGSYIYR
jgi:hypothetical protein